MSLTTVVSAWGLLLIVGIDREVSGHQLSAISARVKMVIGVMVRLLSAFDVWKDGVHSTTTLYLSR